MSNALYLALWLALVAGISITWRGSEAEAGSVRITALMRRLRQLLRGSVHRDANRARVEGRLGPRTAVVELSQRGGQPELYCQLACGPSPTLLVLPAGERVSIQQLKSYYQADRLVSRLHTIFTDDAKRVRALLGDESRLRMMRVLCAQKGSRLSMGGGRAEMRTPMLSGDETFDVVERQLRALEAVAAGFERGAPKLPVPWFRKLAGWFFLGLGLLVLAGILYARGGFVPPDKPPVEKPPEVQHFEVEIPGGWRPVTAADFDKEDLGWFSNYGRDPLGEIFVDFDGSQQETGTVLVLRRVGDSEGPFRVQLYNQGQLLVDDTYPAIAFAVKVGAADLGRAQWSGSRPPRVPSTGSAFAVGPSREEATSTVVYLFLNGKIEKYKGVDFSAL